MNKQTIIVIGREHGSLGHEIAKRLSEQLGIKLYDKEILTSLAKEYDLDSNFVSQYDEKAVNPIVDHISAGRALPMETALAQKVFRFERHLAASGDSFVIVGRCAEYVLKDNPNVVSVFICGDPETKISHIMESRGIDREDAVHEIESTDKQRRNYHDTYAHTKWSDTTTYGLILNSSKLGLDKSVTLIKDYVNLMQS